MKFLYIVVSSILLNISVIETVVAQSGRIKQQTPNTPPPVTEPKPERIPSPAPSRPISIIPREERIPMERQEVPDYAVYKMVFELAKRGLGSR